MENLAQLEVQVVPLKKQEQLARLDRTPAAAGPAVLVVKEVS
jgi:hypothetical protein